MANGHYVIPKLVEDTSLKRARVVDGNGDSYIRVTGTVTSSDLDPIKEALGEPTDTSSDNTVIGLLKKIDVKQFGVGQAYEGSTGGEIFNYYGTDANKNIASASYSTAMGYHNQVKGPYGFAAGSDNSISSGVANSMTLGTSNSCYHLKTVSLGNNLTTTAANQTLVGRYNNTTTALSGPHFVVGVGTSNNAKANAIECNNTATKICNNLQLATDSTEVNAIIPPEDPDYPETDERVLATKWYVDKRTKIGIEEDSAYAHQSWATVVPGDDFDTSISFGAIISFENRDTSKTYSFIYFNTGSSQTIEVGGCTFNCSGGTITSNAANPIIRYVVVLHFYEP